MSRLAPRLAALVLALAAACGSAGIPRPTWPDAPEVLRDDTERAQATDTLWRLPPGPARDAARAAIAAATVERIRDALDDDQPFTADALLGGLTRLWQDDPENIGSGLAPHAEMIERLRAQFARAGALGPTLRTLAVLAEITPTERAARRAEIDEVLAFADELAVADNGPNATRAEPIELLQPAALDLPLPWLVEKYVGLLVERQVAVSAIIAAQGASLPLVRAHHDILATQRRIAIALARAGRVEKIHAVIGPLKGIGADHRDLVLRAELVAEQPMPDAYFELAQVLREEDAEKRGQVTDRSAALAICMAGLAKFPRDPDLLAAAALDARAIGRIEQAIALTERALHATSDVDTTAALRLGKLYGERIARLADVGRPRAAHDAWRGALEFTSDAARERPHTVWQQAAAIAEAALGRGLAEQGLLSEGVSALRGSLGRAESIEAYETLTAIDVRTSQFSAARGWATSGIAMLGERTSGDRYRRARLERLIGDSLVATKPQEAAAHYLESMRAWASLGEDTALPAAVAAERKLDSARAMLRLGDRAAAVSFAIKATDLAPNAPDIVTGVVAFLVENDAYRDALDAYYRGLGSTLSDMDKVSMSLWVVGDARVRGEEPDRLAVDFLTARHGDAWHELLAAAATGRATLDNVRAAATTARRKAELAFYSATLGLAPAAATDAGRRALLSQVVSSRVVFGEEYALAQRYLAR